MQRLEDYTLLFFHLPIAAPQDLVSVDDPTHGAPHALPLIQLRDLICDPAPHDFEHGVQGPKASHLELTEMNRAVFT